MDTNAENVDQVTDEPKDSGTSAHRASQALHPRNFDRKFRTFRSLAYRYMILCLCVFVALCHFKSALEVLMGLAFCVGKDSFLLQPYIYGIWNTDDDGMMALIPFEHYTVENLGFILAGYFETSGTAVVL